MVKYKILDRMAMISFILYYVFVVSSVQQSNAQSISVGDNCRTKENLPGICRILVDCEHVVEGLRLRKINFNNLAHCGFIGSTNVICCPNNYINVNNDQTNTGTGVTHTPHTTYHIHVIESPPKKHYGHFEMPQDVELINPNDPPFVHGHTPQNDRYRPSNPVTFPKVTSTSSLDVSYQDIETIPVIEYNYNDLETTSVSRGLFGKTIPNHEINIRSNNNFGSSQSPNQNHLGGTNRWQIENEYSVQNPHQNTHHNPHQNPYYAPQNGNFHQHPPQTGYYPMPDQMGGHTHGNDNYNPSSAYQQNGNFHHSEKMHMPSSSNFDVYNGPTQHGTYQQNGYNNNNNNNNYQEYPHQNDHSGHNYYSGSHTHTSNVNNHGPSWPDHYNRNTPQITTSTTTAKTPLTVIIDTFKGVLPTITPNDQENEIEWGKPPTTTTKKPFSLIGFGLSLLTTTQKPIPEAYPEPPTTTVKPGLFGTLFGQGTPTQDHTTEKSNGFSFNFNPFSQSTTIKPVPQNPQPTFNQQNHNNHQNIPNESNIYNNYPDTVNSRPEFGGVFSPVPIKGNDSNPNFRPQDIDTAQSVWNNPKTETTTATTQNSNSNLNFWPFNQPENQPEEEWKPPTESKPTNTTQIFGLNLNFWPFNQAENVTVTISTTTQKSESNLNFWPFNQADDVTESEWRPPTETPGGQNVLSSSATPSTREFGIVWDRVVKEPETTAKAVVTTAIPVIFPSDSGSSSSFSSVRPSLSTQDDKFSLLEPWMLNAILESSSTQSTVAHVENINKDTSNNISQRKCEIACEAYTKNSRPPITFHIHGGVPASSGEFPHMVALAYLSENTGETYNFDCGGALISERYVLTAAHCVWRISRRPIFVRLGKVTLFTDDDEAAAVDVGIESFVFHPQYNSSRQYHDLALLKLTKVVTFNEYIHPACLYTNIRDLDNGIDIFATGWGETENGARSNILLKAQLRSVPIEECHESYQSLGSHITRKIPNGITDGQMCVHDAQLIRDTCQGDSGGPIQIVDTDTQMSTIVGVVSFGFSCATDIPSVNARVAYYLDWIESVVWS